MSTRPGAWRLAMVCALSLLPASGSGPLSAQEAGDTLLAAAPRVEAPDIGPTPRSAMIRSFVLWGWGQAAVGSYFRGGVWFSMEASTIYMMFRTIGRLRMAQETNRRVETFARDSLNELLARDTMISRRVLSPPVGRNLDDPVVFEQAVSETPGVATARKLVSARKQQRQDWVTYALFFTLMSGVDAYVNAHLHDFPTTIATEARRDGSVAISVAVPLPVWLGGRPSSMATAASRASPTRRW